VNNVVKPVDIFVMIRKVISMPKRRKKMQVRETTFEREQPEKDEAFLKLTPLQRLIIHEQMRKRIWGDSYGKVSLKGLKVTKREPD
jgi:hypothetical protein